MEEIIQKMVDKINDYQQNNSLSPDEAHFVSELRQLILDSQFNIK